MNSMENQWATNVHFINGSSIGIASSEDTEKTDIKKVIVKIVTPAENGRLETSFTEGWLISNYILYWYYNERWLYVDRFGKKPPQFSPVRTEKGTFLLTLTKGTLQKEKTVLNWSPCRNGCFLNASTGELFVGKKGVLCSTV